jgi:hypothetical protein
MPPIRIVAQWFVFRVVVLSPAPPMLASNTEETDDIIGSVIVVRQGLQVQQGVLV